MLRNYFQLIMLTSLFMGANHLNALNMDDNKICTICLSPLNNKYLVDAWNNTFHTHHEKEGVFCHSCSRIISKGITQGGFLYSDGRHVCSLCQATVVEDDSTIQKSYKSVIMQLKQAGIKQIPNDIPIILINLIELNKKVGNKTHGNLKGFTQSNNHNYLNNTFKIFILFGLPQIEFEATLAHELLHVWIEKNNFHSKLKIIEGFCNLGSMLIYDNDNTHFSKIHLNAMENDPNPIYGEGYRQVKSKYDKLGWEKLIENFQ